jgi:hypothetical protein
MFAKPARLHFKLDNFVNLSTTTELFSWTVVGRCVYTEAQTDCNGNEWKLGLWPEGHPRAIEEGCVGLKLCSCKDEPIDASTDH